MHFNIKENIIRKLNLIVIGFFLSVLLCMIIVIVWASNKGFDLTDEGYYLYSMQHTEGGTAFFEYQKILIDWIGWLDLKIIGYRILRLVLTLFSAIVFAKGLFKLLLKQGKISEAVSVNRIIHFTFILIASLLSYSVYPQSLSYNTLTLVNVQLSAGLILYAISFEEDKLSYRINVILLFAGFIVGFQNFVKFTNGILLAALLGSYLLIFSINNTSWKLRRNKFLWFGGGVILFLVYYSITLGSMVDWGHRLQEAIINTETHSIGSLFGRYFDTALTSFKSILRSYWHITPFFLGVYCLIRFVKTPFITRNTELIKNSFYGLVIVYIVLVAMKLSWNHSGTQFAYSAGNIYVLWLLIGCISLLFYFQGNRNRAFPDLKILFIAFFLFILPLVCSFGTSNSLLVHILQYQFSWFALMLLIAYRVYNKWKTFLYLFIIAVLACSQTISGLVYHPYRIKGTLFDQTEFITEINNSQSIKVDSELKEHLESVSEILEENGFDKDGSILPIYCSPGLTYLLNATSPGSGWFSYSSSLSNCYNLQLGGGVDREKLFFLIEEGAALQEEFLVCLKADGVNFPSDYTEIGIVKGYTNEISIIIYAPKL